MKCERIQRSCGRALTHTHTHAIRNNTMRKCLSGCCLSVVLYENQDFFSAIFLTCYLFRRSPGDVAPHNDHLNQTENQQTNEKKSAKFFRDIKWKTGIATCLHLEKTLMDAKIRLDEKCYAILYDYLAHSNSN